MGINIPWISVVIPTYGEKGVDLTKRCVESLVVTHPQIDDAMEVFIVSDGDTPEVQGKLDAIATQFNSRLLVNEHKGFAAACNAGLKECSGNICYLLNNDTYFCESALHIWSAFAEYTGAGIIGGRLLYPNNTIQHGGVQFVPTPKEQMAEYGLPGWFDHTWRNQPAMYPAAVTAGPALLTGAAFGITRWAIDAVGLLDERYGFSCEDIDYCLASMDSGRMPMYCGYAAIYHAEGATRGATPEEKQKLAPDIAIKERQSLETLFRVWNGVDWRMFQLR